MTRSLGLAALLVAATVWGATFALVKAAIEIIPAETFLFWRFLIGGCILVAGAAFARQLQHRSVFPALILGLLVFVGFWLQTKGLAATTPSRSAFITALAVVAVPFLDRLVYGVAVPPLAAIGTLISIGGISILVGGLDATHWNEGDILTLGCALAFAFHLTVNARMAGQHPAVGLAAVQIAVVAILAIPLVLATPAPFAFSPSGSVIFAIMFSGVVTTALAFLLLVWGQARVSATEAALALAFEPVAAAFTSVLTGAEPVSVSLVLGGGLVIAAMILSQIPGRAQPR